MSDDDNRDRTVAVLPPEPELDEDAVEMERIAAQAGRNGNIYAIHVWHFLREQPRRRVAVDLPALATRDDLEKAQVAVITAAGNGRLTPREALDFSAMLENRRRALATREVEERLRALEKVNAEEAARGRSR